MKKPRLPLVTNVRSDVTGPLFTLWVTFDLSRTIRADFATLTELRAAEARFPFGARVAL